jgi:hypothetical protein
VQVGSIQLLGGEGGTRDSRNFLVTCSRPLCWIASLAAVVLLLPGCDDSDNTAVFDFSTQSLCDWFSPEEIDAIVTSTYRELGVPLDPGDGMDRRQDNNSDCFWSEPLVTLSEWEGGSDWAGTTYESHPALGDSVLVSTRNPGSYGLMNGIEALLRVDGHAEPLWFGHSTGTLGNDVETINILGFTIANKMLQQMGWIDGD